MPIRRRSPSRQQPASDDTTRFYEALQQIIRIQRRDPEVACAWGITIGECHALELLAALGPSTLIALATALNLDKSTASRIVTSLVRKDLVIREVHPESGRSVRLSLTGAGRRLFASVSRANRASYAKILRNVSPRERAGVIRALRKTAELLRGLKAEPLE